VVVTFSFTLSFYFFLFEQGEIRVVLFSKDVEEKFPSFSVGKVYTISGGTVKQAFGAGDRYELSFKEGTTCEEVEMDLEGKEEPFVVSRIADLAGMAKDTVVNVIGVVRKVGEPRTFPEKREVEIIDSSQRACLVTLWGGHSQTEAKEGDILLLREVKISESRGLSLTTNAASRVLVNPERQETTDLRVWATEADLSSGPLIGGGRPVMKLAEIEKAGIVAATITKIFYDRKMTFSREEKLQLVVKVDMKEAQGPLFSVSGSKCSLLFIFFSFDRSPTFSSFLKCSTLMPTCSLERPPKRSRSFRMRAISKQ